MLVDAFLDLQEDIIPHSLLLGQCCSLASALSSVSDHAGIIRTVKRRFDERQEACTNLEKAMEEARVEKENREQLNQAQSERESSLRHEVMYPLRDSTGGVFRCLRLASGGELVCCGFQTPLLHNHVAG